MLENQSVADPFEVGKNDPDNFEGLYEKYVRKIFNFIYYKTHHKETAEDLTSETFMKALKNFSAFKKEKGSFSSWIYSIARNTVIDFYRTKKSHLNIEDIWDLTEDGDILQDLDTKMKLKEARKYLKNFSAEHREIVLLRVWEGMSYKEIAQITGKDEVNCRVIFSRTISSLRQASAFALLALLLFKG